jgi:hypothetical protein
MSTEPERARCSISGVVSTTSPRKEVWIMRLEVRAQSSEVKAKGQSALKKLVMSWQDGGEVAVNR